MESTIRPIRPDERALLERRVQPDTPRKEDVIHRTLDTGIPIWLGLLFVDALLVAWIPFSVAASIAGTAIVIFPMAYWFCMRAERDNVRVRNEGIDGDRAKYRAVQQVEESRVRVVDAIAIEINEDFGNDYYLELEDGRVLVLGEVWLETGDESGDESAPYGPNRQLIVTRMPELRTHTLLEVRCVGEFFQPSHTRQGTDEELFPRPGRRTATSSRGRSRATPSPHREVRQRTSR